MTKKDQLARWTENYFTFRIAYFLGRQSRRPVAVKDLEEKRIEIQLLEVVGNASTVRVIDSGNGVPAHCRDRVFEPLFTTKPTSSGQGLGLSVAKGIVESYGGTLSLVPDHPNT